MEDTALFLGRFQPPSIAHAETVRAILANWKRLVIGVVTPTILDEKVDPKWGDFIRETDPGYRPDRYFYKPEDVKRLWDAHIAHNYTKGEIECHIVPRPFYPSFVTRYPAGKYDMVYPQPLITDTGSDAIKVGELRKLLSRDVFTVTPRFMLHNSEIRKRVAYGDSLEKYLASGTAALHQSIREGM